MRPLLLVSIAALLSCHTTNKRKPGGKSQAIRALIPPWGYVRKIKIAVFLEAPSLSAVQALRPPFGRNCAQQLA